MLKIILNHKFLKRLNSLNNVRCGLSSSLQKDPGSDDKSINRTMQDLNKQIEADKQALQWRTPVGERPDEWKSKFKLFADMEQTSDFIVMMQKDIDLRPKSIKAWWKKRQENHERHMQQFIQERLDILGPDLAAAHFLLYRGGQVKFTNNPGWMKANENKEILLPNRFDPRYTVEGLKCDNMTLYYEGLENLRNLHFLKFLSFHNVKTFDDWCLDRVSGSHFSVLEILDISGTQCTYLGLSCLYRIESLKLLIIDDPKQSLEYELTCAMLAEAMPQLKIIAASEVHNKEEIEGE